MGRFLALGAVLGVVLAVACSNSNSAGAGEALTCPAGFDGGAMGGTFAVSGEGHCSTLLHGTVGNGGACTQDSDCMPTCCACNNDTGRSATVVFCNNGTCVVGPDVCCYWIDPVLGPDGGGTPYECNH